MKIFKQLSIIIGISVIGNYLSNTLKLPIPGSITGMIILLILLLLKIVKEEDIKETADFILKNMGFFFIPACVGIISSYFLLEGFYIQTLSLIACSTILVMGVTGFVAQILTRINNSDDGANNK